MAKFHVSSDGNPRVCTASEGNCPLGGNENHFTSKEAARAAFEESVVASESSTKKDRSRESIRTTDALGDTVWLNSDGQKHRDGDLPAVESRDGRKVWYQNGKIHRDGDQPAYVDAAGTKHWFRNNQLHRDGDLPAAELWNGSKTWFQNGQRHRDGDLPALEGADGTKEWWINGKFQYRVLPDGTREDWFS